MQETEPRADSVASPLEDGLSVLELLDEAPPRTLHLPSILRSSPLSPSVRSMLERREFGRRYDAVGAGAEQIEGRLPGLSVPSGEVEFLADCRSFDDLSTSVDGLLSHRKRLLAPSLDVRRPRRKVLVLDAGPGGLMAAVQLTLRDHRVVVCEQHDAYTRNRFIGVYKDVAHLMAALGMPESMTYDFTHYRGKRGIMLADIQTFLHAVALKLGVIVYTGAIARQITPEVVRSGQLELGRSSRTRAASPSAVGLTRWQFDSVARVRSGVSIHFDTIVEATGGRSGLREALVGPDNVVPLRTIARSAAARDSSLDSFFDDPEDHCAEFVESEYGCPPELRTSFAAALVSDTDEIPYELPCFVSNIDASVLTKPPWVRACALRVLDPSSAAAMAALSRAATDPDPLVCETATAALSGLRGDRYGTIDKVVLLRGSASSPRSPTNPLPRSHRCSRIARRAPGRESSARGRSVTVSTSSLQGAFVCMTEIAS